MLMTFSERQIFGAGEMQKPGPICTLTVAETLMSIYSIKLQRGRNGTPFELSKTVDLRHLAVGVKF
jgi:hypothetical protein